MGEGIGWGGRGGGGLGGDVWIFLGLEFEEWRKYWNNVEIVNVYDWRSGVKVMVLERKYYEKRKNRKVRVLGRNLRSEGKERIDEWTGY